MRRHLSAALLMLGACATTEPIATDPTDPPAPLPGCLRIEPSRLSFDDHDLTARPETQALTVRLANPCEGPVEIVEVEINGRTGEAASFLVSTALAPLVLQPGETVQADLGFRPTTVGVHELEVSVRSDAEDADAGFIATGVGNGPKVEVTPMTYDYGSPYVGCEQSQQFLVRNVGDRPLSLTEVRAEMLGDGFTLDLDERFEEALPLVLDPYPTSGDERPFYLDYLPLDEAPDAAAISVVTDDLTNPETPVTAMGTGTSLGRRTETFIIGGPQRDVVVVVDRSESMRETALDMVSHVGAFMAEVRAAEADVHLAFVVAPDGCVLGPDRFVHGAMSDADARAKAGVMVDIDRKLERRTSDSGLSVGIAALTPPATFPDGCNASLLRDAAKVDVVFVSGRADSDALAWTSYVRSYQSLQRESERARTHVVGGLGPATACEAFERSRGYVEVSIATGGTTTELCGVDWASTWTTLGKDIMTRTRTQVGRIDGLRSTLEVRVDGVLTTAWTLGFDRLLILDEPVPIGTEVEVTYDPLPDCEG